MGKTYRAKLNFDCSEEVDVYGDAGFNEDALLENASKKAKIEWETLCRVTTENADLVYCPHSDLELTLS